MKFNPFSNYIDIYPLQEYVLVVYDINILYEMYCRKMI